MRYIFVLAALSILNGCASPVSDVYGDMMNNQFMAHQAEPVPAGMAGHWTGVSGPYLMTLHLNEDGTGLYCMTGAGSETLSVAKYQGGALYDQGGTRMTLSVTGDRLMGSPPYKYSQPIEFQRDDSLSMANPYCRDSM